MQGFNKILIFILLCIFRTLCKSSSFHLFGSFLVNLGYVACFWSMVGFVMVGLDKVSNFMVHKGPLSVIGFLKVRNEI